MQWALTRLALPAARRTWKPKTPKIEAETRKNRCWKTTHFWHRFWKGSDLVLEWFLKGFLDWRRMPKATIWFLWKANKTLRGRMKFEVRVLQQATKNQQKSMKNRMFFETSIWEAFWMDFGKVLGSQNPWFSQFFRCFSEVVFEAHSGRAEKSI